MLGQAASEHLCSHPKAATMVKPRSWTRKRSPVTDFTTYKQVQNNQNNRKLPLLFLLRKSQFFLATLRKSTAHVTTENN